MDLDLADVGVGDGAAAGGGADAEAHLVQRGRALGVGAGVGRDVAGFERAAGGVGGQRGHRRRRRGDRLRLRILRLRVLRRRVGRRRVGRRAGRRLIGEFGPLDRRAGIGRREGGGEADAAGGAGRHRERELDRADAGVVRTRARGDLVAGAVDHADVVGAAAGACAPSAAGDGVDRGAADELRIGAAAGAAEHGDLDAVDFGVGDRVAVGVDHAQPRALAPGAGDVAAGVGREVAGFERAGLRVRHQLHLGRRGAHGLDDRGGGLFGRGCGSVVGQLGGAAAGAGGMGELGEQADGAGRAGGQGEAEVDAALGIRGGSRCGRGRVERGGHRAGPLGGLRGLAAVPSARTVGLVHGRAADRVGCGASAGAGEDADADAGEVVEVGGAQRCGGGGHDADAHLVRPCRIGARVGRDVAGLQRAAGGVGRQLDREVRLGFRVADLGPGVARRVHMAVLGGDADLAGRARGHAEADLEGHADRVPARLGSVRAVVLGGADHADVAGAAGAVAPAAAARGPVALRARDRIGIGAARRAVEDVEGDRRVVVAEAEAGHRADPLVEVAGVDAVVLDRQLHAVAPVRAGVVVQVAPGLEVAGGVERVQRQGRRSERPAAEPAAERGRIVRRRGRDREDCAQRDGRDDRDQPDALDDAAVGPERRPHSA